MASLKKNPTELEHLKVTVNCSRHFSVCRDCQRAATVDHRTANIDELASRCIFEVSLPMFNPSLYPDITHVVNYPRPFPAFYIL